jgi:hypothetical protein
LQRKPHLTPSQVGVALAGAGQRLQAVPQEFTLLLSLHSLLPHRWKPLRQANPQLLPSQLATALLGGLHGEQEVPHELTSLFETQTFPQLWVPGGQMVMQLVLTPGMHFPEHSCVPAGHSVPHLVPSQVALPPSIPGQGVQDVPQLAGLAFSRQASPQRW